MARKRFSLQSLKSLASRVGLAVKRLVTASDERSDQADRGSWHLLQLEDRRLPSVAPVGSEYRVNTHTQGPQQTFPRTPHAVALNPATGDYVAVWSSQGQNAGGAWDVYLQRYNAAGVAQGGETLVDAPINGVNQQYANVAMNSIGNFVVTWSSQQGGHWNIYAQQYNAGGVAQGSAILVDTPSNNDQQYSTVAINSAGNFVIAWSGQQSGHWQIYANVFSNGVSQTGPIQVTNATNDQMDSDVAMNAAGNFVIAWSGHQSAYWNVYAEMFGSNDQPAGSIFQVNTIASCAANESFLVSGSLTLYE